MPTFSRTEQFRLTLAGDLNIILGRKGSGKTAIFLQARNKVRADRNNIVVDLAPQGFQLIKLKELILDQLSHGTRKEFIAAYWEYIIWLEIAYKLLEKDERRVRYDSRILEPYDRLKSVYDVRVDGSGDFALRLSDLTSRIVDKYYTTVHGGQPMGAISSRTLQAIYGSEISTVRNEVLNYLKLKGIVCLLFDNLDRFWTPTGFADVDTLIIIGLVECLQDIRRRFARSKIDFQWAIFLRSDVYEFVIHGMADHGKLATASIEWTDREMLLRMFERRILHGFGDKPPSFGSIWEGVFCSHRRRQTDARFPPRRLPNETPLSYKAFRNRPAPSRHTWPRENRRVRLQKRGSGTWLAGPRGLRPRTNRRSSRCQRPSVRTHSSW